MSEIEVLNAMRNLAKMTSPCSDVKHAQGCKCDRCRATERERRRNYRAGNGDALSNRAAERGSPEYDYLHRYDSPDNQRDSMG